MDISTNMSWDFHSIGNLGISLEMTNSTKSSEDSHSSIDNLGISLEMTNSTKSSEDSHSSIDNLGISLLNDTHSISILDNSFELSSSADNLIDSNCEIMRSPYNEDNFGVPTYTSTPSKSCEEYGAVKAKRKACISLEKQLSAIINPGYRMMSKALDSKKILLSLRKACSCGRNCIKSYTARSIYDIRYNYWIKPRYLKMQWLTAIINSSEKKGRFRLLNIDNKKVCVKGFCTLLEINKNTYCRAKKLSDRSSVTLPCKNPKTTSDKTLSTISWLETYANFYGDRMPNSDDILLPYKTVRRTVYKKYMVDCRNGIVSESYFYKIWNERLPHLKIKKSSSFSKCSTCYMLERHQEKTLCPRRRLQLRKQKEEHNERQMSERRLYYTKRDQSKSDPDNYMSIIIDGMDQSKSNLPHFAGRTSKNINPADLLKTHITGVINHGHGGFHSYVDYNQFPHDPNLTMNIILKSINEAASCSDNKLPPLLYLQADNCSRENKNKYMLGFLQLLVMKNIFREVQLSFLIVGHTHEDIDGAFSGISRKLRSSDSETLPDLMNLVGQCELLNSLYDIKSWILPHLNELTGISRPLHFKISMVSSEVKTYYRGHCQDIWKQLNLNPLNGLPTGVPKRLKPDFSKIDATRNFKQIEVVKSYFRCESSYTFWKAFYDKLLKGNSPLVSQANPWMLEELPVQRCKENDGSELPPEVTLLLNKEKATPQMNVKSKTKGKPHNKQTTSKGANKKARSTVGLNRRKETRL